MKEDLRVKSNKYFKPKYGERYWFVDTRGGIHWYHWRDDNLNNLLYLNNEVYRTGEEAEFARDENQFLLKMQRDFEDNSDVIDWSDSTQTKHTLDYTHNVGWLGMASDGTLQEGKLYTTNLDWLKQYIKDNEEDIIRYYFRITDGSSDNNSSGSRVSAEELIIPSEGSNISSFSYCLKSGRQWNFTDYYELYEFKDDILKFRVYDANMFPSPNFESWSNEAITEVVGYVKNRFKNFNGVIYLDNYKVDLTN